MSSQNKHQTLGDLSLHCLILVFLPLFSVVDLETSNILMPAAAELMMPNRLLIVPGVEHAMRYIGVNLPLLVLRHRGYIYIYIYIWCCMGVAY